MSTVIKEDFQSRIEENPRKFVADAMRELGIPDIEVPFNCGGDEMGELFIDNLEIEGVELPEYIDLWQQDHLEGDSHRVQLANALFGMLGEFIMHRVEFAVVSDGHYDGESGTVQITLDDIVYDGCEKEDCEEDDWGLYVSKEATQEFNEEVRLTRTVLFTDEEVDFINQYVDSFMHDEWEGESVNYKQDFVMDDDKQKMVKQIQDKLGTEYGKVDFKSSEELNLIVEKGDYEEVECQEQGGFMFPAEEDGEIKFDGNFANVEFIERFWCYYRYDD